MRSVAALLITLVAGVAEGHDFWIEPSAYRVVTGMTVSLALRVGMDFNGDPVARFEDAQIVRFEARSAGKVSPVAGTPGAAPAGTIVAGPGLTVVVFHSNPSYVAMPEPKLDAYIEDEGLEKIREMRRNSPYANTPWREIFSREAKTLLWSGKGSDKGFDAVVGMPLEIVPEKNPYKLEPGLQLPVRVLFRGKPVSDVLVTAFCKSDPLHPQKLRTDARGRVTLDLPCSGPFLIKAVNVAPAPAGARGNWESFWASLTFEVP